MTITLDIEVEGVKCISMTDKHVLGTRVGTPVAVQLYLTVL